MSNLLKILARSLDQADISYMVIGGQAVLLYGEPRFTRDIDVTLALKPEELPRLMEVVKSMGLKVLVENPGEFVERTWVLPTLDENTGFRIDFILSWTPYEQQAISRARAVAVEGYPVRFATPEDVVIHKVLAGRPRDIEDVRTILRKQKVDSRYILHWLKAFSETLEHDFANEFAHLYKEVRNEL